MAQGRKTQIDRDLHTSAELRARAHGKLPALTIERMLAIANALDGTTFSEAERTAGIEPQALAVAIKRYPPTPTSATSSASPQTPAVRAIRARTGLSALA